MPTDSIFTLRVPLACVVLIVRIYAAEPAQDSNPIDPAALRELIPEKLREQRQPLADEQNAWVLWKQATEKYVRPSVEQDKAMMEALKDENVFPSGDNALALTEWFQKNEPALGLLDASLKYERAQFPIYDEKQPVPEFTGLRALARLKCLKAKQLAATGKFEQAVEEIAGTERLAELMLNGDGPVIHGLVGIAIDNLANGTAVWLARQNEITDSILQRLLNSLPQQANEGALAVNAYQAELSQLLIPLIFSFHAPTPEGVAEKIVNVFPFFGDNEPEYQKKLKALKKLIASHPQPLDINDTVKLTAGFLLRITHDCECPWVERDLELEKDIKALKHLSPSWIGVLGIINLQQSDTTENIDLDKWKKQWRSESNPVGKLLLGLCMPAFNGTSVAFRRMAATRAATATIIGLRLFLLRKGTLPENLDELVAQKILKAVPRDPFSNAAIRYSKEKQLVWSVGEDGVDNGGKASKDNEPGTDIVWPLRFPVNK